ncbi:hypothetical protein YC2023_066046 [Brassica napus]
MFEAFSAAAVLSLEFLQTSPPGPAYTQDVPGSPPAHTGRLWLSVCVRQHTRDVRGCPSVHILERCTHRTSVGVRQHTKDVRGCLWLSVSTHRTSVCVRVCLSAHTGCLWVSVSTHRTSVCVRQHTQDIRGCSCVSVCTHRTFVAVHQYTYRHVGPWTLHAGLPVDCLGDFGPRGLSVQYTQDVCGCPPAHTGRPWLSVCVRVCPLAHTGRPWLSISTHISTLVLGLSTLTLPLDSSGDLGPRGLSVQYTQDVRGCPSAHTGRPCVSVSIHRTSGDVRVYPCVSVSTHRTSVAVHQYTYQHYTQDVRGCPPAHTVTQDVCGCPCVSVCVPLCPSAHRGRLWLSISTHISTLVLGLSTLAVPVDCLGDFGPRGLSVQYTQDVRGCPPAHTRRLWLSVSTHRTSVAVRVCPYMSGGVRQHTQDVCGCPWSVSTHRTSVAIHQYTYQYAGPWSQHAGPSSGLFW